MAAPNVIAVVVYLVFLFAVYIAVAIANGFLAARLDRNAAAWVILSLIPIVKVSSISTRFTSCCSALSTD